VVRPRRTRSAAASSRTGAGLAGGGGEGLAVGAGEIARQAGPTWGAIRREDAAGEGAVGGAAADEALSEDAADGGGEGEGFDTEVEEAREDEGGAAGVDGGGDEVAGEAGLERDGGGLAVADLADEDDVGVLAEEGAEGAGDREARGGVDLGLADAGDAAFDGVLDGDDGAAAAAGEEVAEGGVEGGGLAAAGGAGEEDDAFGLVEGVREVGEDGGGEAEVGEGAGGGGADLEAEGRAFAVDRGVGRDADLAASRNGRRGCGLPAGCRCGTRGGRQGLQPAEHPGVQVLGERLEGLEEAVAADGGDEAHFGRVEVEVAGAEIERASEQSLDGLDGGRPGSHLHTHAPPSTIRPPHRKPRSIDAETNVYDPFVSPSTPKRRLRPFVSLSTPKQTSTTPLFRCRGAPVEWGERRVSRMGSTYADPARQRRTVHGGAPEGVADAFEAFLGKVERVLFVPWALQDHDGYVRMMVERGFTAGRALDSIHRAKDPKAAVRDAQAVLVGGGNTWRLLDRVQKAGLLPLLRRRVAAGLPYVGISAGTNLACPSIRTTNDMPICELRSTAALGLVPFQRNAHFTDGAYFIRRRLPPVRRRDPQVRLLEFLEENPGRSRSARAILHSRARRPASSDPAAPPYARGKPRATSPRARRLVPPRAKR
jgi:dipeptidase E